MLPETSHPLFPANPSKSWSPVKPPPLFENSVGGSTQPAESGKWRGEGGGGGEYYVYTLQIYSDFVFLHYITYFQLRFSIISFQTIFSWINFHKIPICHIRDILKQAGKFL